MTTTVCYDSYMQVLQTKNFEIAANLKGDPNAQKVAILLPGRLDTKDYVNFTSHLDYLASKGFYTLAIDPPGTWDSPGKIEDYSTSTYVQAVNELIEYLGNRPTLLLGHSRGGATAMLASSNPAVAGIAVVNAAYGMPSMNTEKVVNGIVHESRDLPPGNVHTDEQRAFNLSLNYFVDGAKHDPKAALLKFKGPKLIVHASADEFVSIEQAKETYAKLTDPKIFLEIDCNHDYRLYPDAIEAVERALDIFIDKYLS